MKEALDLALTVLAYSTSFSMICMGASTLLASFAMKEMVEIAKKEADYFASFNTPKEPVVDAPATV